MLQTDRLILRALQAEDAAWLASEIAVPEVQRWLTTPPHPYTISDAEAFVKRTSNLQGHRVIEMAATPCGVVSISDKSGDGILLELGFWLRKSAWGQGIMTEAVCAMLDWHFATQPSLESGWIVGNSASENVHRKLGFRETGEIRQIWSHFHRSEMPVVRVRLDRADWADVDRSGARLMHGDAAKESETS